LVLNALGFAWVVVRDQLGLRARAHLMGQVVAHPSQFKDVWAQGPDHDGDCWLFVQSRSGVRFVLADRFEYAAARARLRDAGVAVREPDSARAPAATQWIDERVHAPEPVSAPNPAGHPVRARAEALPAAPVGAHDRTASLVNAA
jgi:hypothetical protein